VMHVGQVAATCLHDRSAGVFERLSPISGSCGTRTIGGLGIF
jgi:hypothetical protein